MVGSAPSPALRLLPFGLPLLPSRGLGRALDFATLLALLLGLLPVCVALRGLALALGGTLRVALLVRRLLRGSLLFTLGPPGAFTGRNLRLTRGAGLRLAESLCRGGFALLPVCGLSCRGLVLQFRLALLLAHGPVGGDLRRLPRGVASPRVGECVFCIRPDQPRGAQRLWFSF